MGAAEKAAQMLVYKPLQKHQVTLSIPGWLNSLTPGRFQFDFRYVIFKLTLVYGGWGISYEISLRRKPQDLTDDKSTLVQVMAWCRQATSHYLSQCWPRSMSPNGITRLQWVKYDLPDWSTIVFQKWYRISQCNLPFLGPHFTKVISQRFP